MPDYAKELRMSRIDRLLTEEFDDCVSKNGHSIQKTTAPSDSIGEC